MSMNAEFEAATSHHACAVCDGELERELVSVYPASEVCLECMDPSGLRQLENDLNQAAKLDHARLTEVPRVPGWEIGVHYRPSRILSGDFYDVRRHDDGRVTLLLGDVMGKGFPAALLRTGLHSTLNALSAEIVSPARVLEKANRHFLGAASPGRLASVFLASLDASSGALLYANAGHLPALLEKRVGPTERLGATGMVLGAMENARFEDVSLGMERGDLLVTYSDGITEASDPDGSFFEETGLAQIVRELSHAPAQVVASGVAEALGTFAPGDPSDDRTLLAVRRA